MIVLLSRYKIQGLQAYTKLKQRSTAPSTQRNYRSKINGIVEYLKANFPECVEGDEIVTDHDQFEGAIESFFGEQARCKRKYICAIMSIEVMH